MQSTAKESPYEALCNLSNYAYVYRNEYNLKLVDQSKFEELHERISEEADNRNLFEYIWRETVISFDFPYITVKPL